MRIKIYYFVWHVAFLGLVRAEGLGLRVAVKDLRITYHNKESSDISVHMVAGLLLMTSN